MTIVRVFLCISLATMFSTICQASDDQDPSIEVATSFGVMRVVRPDYSPDTITLNGKTIFRRAGHYISLQGVFRVTDGEAALLSVNCGGSACPPDDLYFILLRANKTPTILPINATGSIAPKPRQEKGRVVVDLGFSKGRKLTAELKRDKVVIHSVVVHGIQVGKEDCEWLFDVVTGECVDQGSNLATCEAIRKDEIPYLGSMPLRISTYLPQLANHPGFVARAFHDACVEACRTREAGPYGGFEKTVCGAK